MATVITNALLFNIFAGTLSAEKATREAAEHALGELSTQHPDLVLHLLRFCCGRVPSADGVPVPHLCAHTAASSPAEAQQRHVLLAAAIRVRNVLGRSDWGRNPYFTEDVKIEVRQLLVPLQCQPHVAEHIRRQLLETTKELMVYDYPEKWPGLVPQLNNLLDGWVAAFRSALVAFEGDVGSDQVASVVLQLKGGLGVLRACCKIYEDPLRVDTSDVDRFAGMFLPSLVSLSQLFFGLWRDEVYRVCRSSQSLVGGPAVGNLFELSPILTELSHCLRLILKCAWSLLSTRMPKCLCSGEGFHTFWATCVAEPLAVYHEAYLPLCRARLRHRLHTPGMGGDAVGDGFATFQESAMWKQLKWMYTIALKLVQEFLEPRSCEKRVRAVATAFSNTAVLPTVRYALELVRWHACPSTDLSVGGEGSPVQLLTSKAYILALEVVSAAVHGASVYTDLIHPAAEELMTGLLLPRLAFSAEDAELWLTNPEEYVRRQSNPVGDLFSAKVVSAGCLMALAVPSRAFHDTALLGSLVNVLVNQLQVFSAQAAQAVSEESSGPAVMEAARRVDAALFCMFHFKKVLSGMKLGDDKLEYVLNTFVVPATRYPLGFLRARAVLVLSVFAPSLQWSSPQSYQAALQSVLPLLSDGETPVRVQTCVSFARLIRHPYAREVVTPCIAQLIQHYFDVMRLMDNEAVVRTLRRTIAYYHDSLSQWGLELTDMLVAHFQTVLHNVSVKYRALEATEAGGGTGGLAMSDCLEDDGFADVLMAADELLDTLTTLVKALPSDLSDTPGNIFVQLQHRISPMLYVILSHQGGSTYGFMDPTLMLLTTLLSRSPRVVGPTWRLLPCLHELVVRGGAVDYFGQMLTPFERFVAVSPNAFLFAPLHALCEWDAGASLVGPAELGSLSPLQVTQGMASCVLQRASQLTGRELGAVPRLYDSAMQQLWMRRRTVASAAEAERELQLSTAVVSATTQQLLPWAQTSRAAAGPTERATLRVLFSNAVFSCVMADAAAALQVLATTGALHDLYERYVVAVLGDGGGHARAPSGVLSHLRGYDRSVFVVAFCEAARLLLHSAWSPAHAAALPTLSAVATSTVLEALAAADHEAAEAELRVLERRLQRAQRRQASPPTGTDASLSLSAGGGAEADAGDSEAWEDASSSDMEDADFDDDDDDGFDDDVDDDADEFGEEGGADDEGDDACGGDALGFGAEDVKYFSQDKRLQAMLRRAQQLRGGRGHHAGASPADGGEGGDDYEDVEDDVDDANANDEDENLLDEEDEDFSSPVQAVNAWGLLLDEVLAPLPCGSDQVAGSPGASLAARLQEPGVRGAFEVARATVDRLFVARAALAALTSGH